jgi:hypothetical protein
MVKYDNLKGRKKNNIFEEDPIRENKISFISKQTKKTPVIKSVQIKKALIASKKDIENKPRKTDTTSAITRLIIDKTDYLKQIQTIANSPYHKWIEYDFIFLNKKKIRLIDFIKKQIEDERNQEQIKTAISAVYNIIGKDIEQKCFSSIIIKNLYITKLENILALLDESSNHQEEYANSQKNLNQSAILM